MAIEVAEFLVGAEVRAIAVDFTVDKLPPGQPPQDGDCPIHRIVLPKMIPLIENLINLDKLVGKEFGHRGRQDPGRRESVTGDSASRVPPLGSGVRMPPGTLMVGRGLF